MAAAHGTATHIPAGSVATSALATGNEAREYERILRISDEVFSGSHPRLKVPQQFVRKSGARNGQTAPASQAQVAKPRPPESSPESPSVLEGTTRPPRTSQPTSAGNAPSTAIASAAPSSAHAVPKSTSEIDPIFLTKSDDLVRAEIQLQRQRAEKALREQLEQKKQETKQRPTLQDTKPEFDVSQVLNRALEMVKPVTLSDCEAHAPGAPSDSFDDNSVYSSRAPDSPPQMGDHRKPSPLPKPAGPATRVPVDNHADELQRLEALNPPGSDQEMHDAYPVADQRALYQKHPHHGQPQQQVEAQEEPEYSPPEPGLLPMDMRDDQYGMSSGEEKRGRFDGRYPGRIRESRRQPSPTNDVRVVQNHITSPAAPRPSLVSPLTTAKLSSVQQLRDERSEHESDRVYSDPDSGRASPNAPKPVISRKRRRLHGDAEGSRHASYRKQNADPPETYIKDEPVSPPPFADSPAVLRTRHPPERPMYVDIASPRYTPVVERHAQPVREQVYEGDGYHEHPVESAPPRTISRLSTKRPARDDGDLRRVASVQYARQEYPREYIEASSRPARAASYAVVERPSQERLRYYESPPAHRYVAANELPHSTHRGPYYEEVPPERIMAPPPRRIVVDEHGTQYYEILPTPRMEPMAPPPRPVSQMSTGEVYEERMPLRPASVRAPSTVEDPYSERRYVQEMPPPQPVYRRVQSDYTRPANTEKRVYAAPLDDHAAYSRSSSVQVAEYHPPHRTTYLQEYDAPSERVIRTSSVRPTSTRYEEPREVIQRVERARPAGHTRESSVYVEDRNYPEYRVEDHQPGEYWDQQFYVPTTRPVREQGYYEDENGGQVALDSAGNLVQGAPQRY